MTSKTLEIAEKLYQEANSEEEYRAATSRAYFAAIEHIFAHPKLNDFRRTRTGEDHRLIIEHLKNSFDPSLVRLGVGYLARLRALRNRADYDQEIPFTKGLANDALERATEIIYEFLPLDET